MTTRYHINSKCEVKPCSASIKTCRYADNTPNHGHFSNYEQAEKIAEEKLQKTFATISSVSKVKKNSTILKKLSLLSKNGVKVNVENSRSLHRDTESGSLTVLSDSKKNDEDLLKDIRSGRVKAFSF